MTQLDRMAKYNEEENLKHRLLRAITKRITTSFIAALVNIEKEFGSLLNDNALNLSEASYKERFERLRTIILDKGNEQVRGAQADLTNYFNRGKGLKNGTEN